MATAGPSQPQVVLDSGQIAQGIQRLAREIHQRHPDPGELALVGIHTGGGELLDRLQAELGRLAGRELELDKGLVDISFYRDDWTRLTQMPRLRSTDIAWDVGGRQIILADDVIFTGRTVRAALDAIFSLGRPARVELAVLVDRGHREFPISPDYVGHHLDTRRHQSVNLHLFPDPARDRATLEEHKYRTLKAAYAGA
jgi:pyrimidine operon attenuation protein/uracil phosphoribosyltransferase